MKNLLFYCCLGALFFQSCNAPTPNTTTSDLVRFADSLFQTSVDSAFIAGAAVIVHQNGKTLLDKSYGYASLELEVPTPLHANFEIGSVTKQFTGAAILKLEEMGKLSLEDDFTKYLDFDTKGRKVTINQLLDHTSGIASYTEVPTFWPLSYHTYPRDTMLRIIEEEAFLFEPGEAVIYNNTAFFFLGLIIEELSDTTYEAFLKEHIFDPLDMQDTYYCSNSKVVKNKVSGYGYSPKGLQQAAYLDHTWPYAAGSLCSTTPDLLKWLQANHKDKWPNEGQYQKLITPGSLNDGTPINYAKGIGNWVDNGHPIISHGGGINGFLTETRYYPESDLYVITLVNTTGPKGAGFFADQLTWEVLEKEAFPKEELDIPLAGLEGTYTGQVRGRMHSIEIGTLADGITMLNQGAQSPDTLTHYAGASSWRDGNNVITLQENEMRVRQGYGAYYILKKE